MSESFHLCMGCMNELDRLGHCTHCSYTSGGAHIKPYLSPETVLDDRYIVGKLLTRNGEGASYIGYDMVTNEKVVVREYIPETLCTRNSGSDKIIVNYDCLPKYKTFMSEFAEVYKVLSKMRSLQHIVPAKDLFTQNNTTYAVLEYVEGVSLTKFLQANGGTLPWEQIRKLFPPIFTTLSLVHNAGIIHRGISPENILITTKGELKLIGFCISSIRTCNTELAPELYAGYAAQEQYNTLEYQGPWTDVYAIAAVLYRMLTGCVPAEAFGRIGNDTLIEPRRINPEVPANVSRVIMDAMAVKCDRRIQTVTELVTRLFEQPSLVEHQKGATQTIPIQRIKQPPPPRKPPQRKKSNALPVSMAIFGIVLLVGLVVFLLVVIFGGDNPDEVSSKQDFSAAQTTTAPVTTAATTLATTGEADGYGTGSIMPDLVGQYYPTVEATVRNDFTVEMTYQYSDEFDSEMIIKQSIPKGTNYDPARKPTLVLTISSGPEEVEVPSYAGMAKKEYLEKLSDLKIKYDLEDYPTNDLTAGYVYKTSVLPGEKINVKSAETLMVYVAVAAPESEPTAETTESTAETAAQ
ncbi:MAG: PASTA domain-containing protein [Oscillospiraceae bacterium]